MPILSQFRQWRNGETFRAQDYVYERDTIVNQLNRLSAILGDSSDTASLTVGSITTTSITLGGETVTSFAEAGTKIHYETLPADATVDDLFISYE
jgi:hypothetical protein